MHFADQADLFSPHRRPKCSRAELGTCPAPCAARCSAAEYADNVCEATRFLDGETDAPLDRLRSRMEEAAAAREFELAARLRDRERRLRVLRDDVVLFRDFLAGLTFLYRVPSEPTGPDRGYVLSGGRVLFSFSFTSDPDFLPELRDRVTAVLSQQMPTSYGTDVGIREEIFLVARWFRWKPHERDRAIPFKRLEALAGCRGPLSAGRLSRARNSRGQPRIRSAQRP